MVDINGTNRLFLRVGAGLTVAVVVAVSGVVFGHITKPAHDVAEQRMDTFESEQLEQGETIKDIDAKLDASLIEQSRQTAILESIDSRLDALEP